MLVEDYKNFYAIYFYTRNEKIDTISNKILDELLFTFYDDIKEYVQPDTFEYFDEKYTIKDYMNNYKVNIFEKIKFIIDFYGNNDRKEKTKVYLDEIRKQRIDLDIFQNIIDDYVEKNKIYKEEYLEIKKNLIANRWLVKKFKLNKYKVDWSEKEKNDSYGSIQEKPYIETFNDLNEVLLLIEKQNIKPIIFLFNAILLKLPEILESYLLKDYRNVIYEPDSISINNMILSPHTLNLLLYIKKIFFHKVFENIIPNHITFQIILSYVKQWFFSTYDIKNLLNIAGISSTDYFSVYAQRDNFDRTFQMTLWDIKKELIKRYQKKS